jgi:hypothetical protein
MKMHERSGDVPEQTEQIVFTARALLRHKTVEALAFAKLLMVSYPTKQRQWQGESHRRYTEQSTESGRLAVGLSSTRTIKMCRWLSWMKLW